MSELELFTISRAKTARGCMKEHLMKYDLGFRPVVEEGPFRFGTLTHRGLEGWYRAIKAGAPQDEWLGLALNDMQGEADPFDLVKAEVLLQGYHLRWQNESYEVLEVEAQFETPLINPETGSASRTWMLAGKIDAIVRCVKTGRILIIEHKTSSEDIRPGSPYWRRLQLDGQVSVYFDGSASLGFNAHACLYDVIGKPGQKPLKATPVEERKYTKPTKTEPSRLYANQRAEDETPEEYRARLIEAIAADPAGYYQRCEVVRLENELEEARYDIWQTAQAVQRARLIGKAPRNPDHCQRFGRLCGFFDVCCGVASLEDPALFKKLDSPHPELTEAA